MKISDKIKTIVCDFYKVGKLNNYKGLDKNIDWTNFLEKTVKLLREKGKAFYIKHDLRVAAESVRLFGNEVNPDEYSLTWSSFDQLSLFED